MKSLIGIDDEKARFLRGCHVVVAVLFDWRKLCHAVLICSMIFLRGGSHFFKLVCVRLPKLESAVDFVR